MPLFVLIGHDKPGAAELRAATREAHLAYVRGATAVQPKVGGPFLDEAGGSIGSLLVVEAPDQAAAAAFQAGDPYAQAGLFASTELRAWKVTVGELA
jgi:uncharacterized protein